MAGTGFARAENSCRNAVAQPFQCWHDGVELSVSVPRHVFAEDTIRPAAFDDPQDLVDEEPLVVGPCALSGNAVWLARVARSEDMNEATPWFSVEGGKVRPDSSGMQGPFANPRGKRGGRIGFPLHVSDAARSGFGNADAKFKSADSGAQAEAVEGSQFGT